MAGFQTTQLSLHVDTDTNKNTHHHFSFSIVCNFLKSKNTHNFLLVHFLLMPQSSRLKTAKASFPPAFLPTRCMPWRGMHARAPEPDDHLYNHFTHLLESHHLQDHADPYDPLHAPRPEALDQSYPTSIVKVHHT